MFRKNRNSVFYFYIVLFQSFLLAEGNRMNGPIFKSVLNTPMAMNSAEEKGSEGQMPTEKSAHLFSMRISLTCQRIYNSNKIKQYQPRQLRINIELRQHKGKRKVTLELLLFGHLI